MRTYSGTKEKKNTLIKKEEYTYRYEEEGETKEEKKTEEIKHPLWCTAPRYRSSEDAFVNQPGRLKTRYITCDTTLPIDDSDRILLDGEEKSHTITELDSEVISNKKRGKPIRRYTIGLR